MNGQKSCQCLQFVLISQCCWSACTVKYLTTLWFPELCRWGRGKFRQRAKDYFFIGRAQNKLLSVPRLSALSRCFLAVGFHNFLATLFTRFINQLPCICLIPWCLTAFGPCIAARRCSTDTHVFLKINMCAHCLLQWCVLCCFTPLPGKKERISVAPKQTFLPNCPPSRSRQEFLFVFASFLQSDGQFSFGDNVWDLSLLLSF